MTSHPAPSTQLLASVPLDAVDGQPLRYRRNADGTFSLYSIGENGVDAMVACLAPAQVLMFAEV